MSDYGEGELPPIYSNYGDVIRRVLHAPAGASIGCLHVNFCGCAFEVGDEGTRVGVIEDNPIGYEYATLEKPVGGVGVVTDVYVVERENPRAPGDPKTWRRAVIATGPGFEASLHEWSVRGQESRPMVIVGQPVGDDDGEWTGGDDGEWPEVG